MNTEMKWSEGLIDKVRNARHVVVFTGAGVSKDSGIPTFRDNIEGLWKNFDVQRLSTPTGFQQQPDMVWGWYEQLRYKVQAAQPNAAHLAIAHLADLVPKVSVITQNVDDLHERAGSQEVIHLHGSLFAPRCAACASPHEIACDRSKPLNAAIAATPRCLRCNGRIRPGVVWFGEGLPKTEFSMALAAVNDCDLFFSVGTSVDVYPAASLPLQAVNRKVCVIQVNPARTDLSPRATFNLRDKAALVLPDLLQAISSHGMNHE